MKRLLDLLHSRFHIPIGIVFGRLRFVLHSTFYIPIGIFFGRLRFVLHSTFYIPIGIFFGCLRFFLHSTFYIPIGIFFGRLRFVLHSTFYILHSKNARRAFTLLELVIFTAIFSVTIIAFISVLISITRTQVRQTAVTEVNQQSQFVLQAVQYYVERSSVIDIADNTATTSATLRMPASIDGDASNEDPTLIFASGTQIFSKVGTNPAQALTSTRVLVSNFTMTKRSNAPAKDSLSVSFTISYNTANPQQQFIQSLTSSVARVNAASFDSNLTPVTNTQKIGTGSTYWQSINDALYFNGSYAGVGTGVTNYGSPFQVRGGDIFIDQSASGIILRNGVNCWRLSVTSGGIATTTSATCQ